MIPTLIPAASPDLDFGLSVEIGANLSQHLSFKLFSILSNSVKDYVCQMNNFKNYWNSNNMLLFFLWYMTAFIIYIFF